MKVSRILKLRQKEYILIKKIFGLSFPLTLPCTRRTQWPLLEGESCKRCKRLYEFAIETYIVGYVLKNVNKNRYK